MRRFIVDIQKFKKILLQEKAKILEILSTEKELIAKTQDEWSEPKDPEDLANLTMSDDLRKKIYENEFQKLNEIEEALERIAMGKYGICERCGGAIEEERLELIPWTKYCSTCSKNIGRGR
ncbi:MAG: TraR/DksA C4-type zinc finger protein [bacterium]|nr:TraR/DksA C4-type zinc finger protein [bacterium]